MLSLAIRAFPGSVDLATTFVSFEAMHDVNKARKLAKELLKANRTDLRLWNEYARGEARNAKLDEARRVYDTALTMCRDMPAQSRRDAMLLFRNYIEVIVDHLPDQPALALHVLISATEEAYAPHQPEVAAPPTRLVRARKVYHEWLTQARETLAWEADFAHKMVCFAYFEYFTTGIDAVRRTTHYTTGADSLTGGGGVEASAAHVHARREGQLGGARAARPRLREAAALARPEGAVSPRQAPAGARAGAGLLPVERAVPVALHQGRGAQSARKQTPQIL